MLDEFKCCNVCGEEKMLSEFSVDKTAKDGRHYTCKDCIKDQARDWRAGKCRHRYTKKGRYYECKKCGREFIFKSTGKKLMFVPSHRVKEG